MYTFKEYIKREILKSNEKFSWLKVYRKLKSRRENNYIFWYRASYVLYRKNNRFLKSISKKINKRINSKYCCDFNRKSDIGIGLYIAHLSGIVIAANVKIGEDFVICQNTTIGLSGHQKETVDGYYINIGSNVNVGANTCIIGSGLTIGDNVIIGAMSFVNDDISSNRAYITKKQSYTKQINKKLTQAAKCGN